MKYLTRALVGASFFSVLSFAVHAQTTPPVKPGLWEIRSRTEFDGERNLTVNQQISELPPVHQARALETARNKGVAMDGINTERTCITAAHYNSGKWPGAAECTVTFGERTASNWKWHASCPRANSDGEVAFSDAEHYQMRSVVTILTNPSKPKIMRRTAEYTWRGDNCNAG